MGINFSVVELFYNKINIDWNAFPGNTVSDLMIYLKSNDPNFTYITASVPDPDTSGQNETIVTQFTVVQPQCPSGNILSDVSGL